MHTENARYKKSCLFFTMKTCTILFYILLTLFVSCARKIQGEFAWNTFYDRDLPPLERSLLQPTQFRFGRENLYFSDQNTIWWMYRIDEIGFGTRSLLAALYSVSGSAEPVEIDLREVPVEKSGDILLLRQYYNPLPAGDYTLKIAHESVPVDEVSFSVISDEELAISSGPLPGDEYRNSFSDSTEDDLARYSNFR
jgi:hypothetical protein